MTQNPHWPAVANWYHAMFTGAILRTIVQRNTADAAALMFRVFRRQHHERFLPGLEKLGLRGLPDAVAAASYHYLSNRIGGVRVEFMRESDRKAWVRFPPPRWVWHGISVCAIPGDVATAMLRGWQAHNGVSLGNPRLGFVCTKQMPDGQPGLEGYFYEHDHDLPPEDRLRFARHEEAPEFDPEAAPKLDSSLWPAERLAKAHRNYAMEYVRSLLPEALHQFGPQDSVHLIGGAARLIAMQLYAETAHSLDVTGTDAASFAQFWTRLGAAQGDEVTVEPDGSALILRQPGWSLMRGVPERHHPALFDCWNALMEGALAAHNHRLRAQVLRRPDETSGEISWRIGPQNL